MEDNYNNYEATVPKWYRLNVDNIEDIEDVKEVLREIGVKMWLQPGESLEDSGKSPEWWEEDDSEVIQ